LPNAAEAVIFGCKRVYKGVLKIRVTQTTFGLRIKGEKKSALLAQYQNRRANIEVYSLLTKEECASYIITWSKDFSVLPEININFGL
jgi:hypothetical protein